MQVVVFTSNNARILNVPDTAPYENSGNVVINPDLALVRGLPPHQWKLIDGQIVPKADHEVLATETSHRTTGVDNDVQRAVQDVKTVFPWGSIAVAIVVMIAIAEAAYILCHR